MKVSIITACFDSENTIEDTILSVASQTYSDIEHIVVDGFSGDSTNRIINSYSEEIACYISEKDNGIYDAINKGIKSATGDIIGVLNSDDIFFNNQIVSKIVRAFQGNAQISAVFGDIGFYDRRDLSSKRRHYSSRGFEFGKFSRGIMPAHPSMYVLKKCYEKAGLYKTCYKIASDFDMALRIFSLQDFSYIYLEEEMVKMRLGGISTSGFKATYRLNMEILDSLASNGIDSNIFTLLSRYPSKVLEFVVRC